MFDQLNTCVYFVTKLNENSQDVETRLAFAHWLDYNVPEIDSNIIKALKDINQGQFTYIDNVVVGPILLFIVFTDNNKEQIKYKLPITETYFANLFRSRTFNRADEIASLQIIEIKKQDNATKEKLRNKLVIVE